MLEQHSSPSILLPLSPIYPFSYLSLTYHPHLFPIHLQSPAPPFRFPHPHLEYSPPPSPLSSFSLLPPVYPQPLPRPPTTHSLPSSFPLFLPQSYTLPPTLSPLLHSTYGPLPPLSPGPYSRLNQVISQMSSLRPHGGHHDLLLPRPHSAAAI